MTATVVVLAISRSSARQRQSRDASGQTLVHLMGLGVSAAPDSNRDGSHLHDQFQPQRQFNHVAER